MDHKELQTFINEVIEQAFLEAAVTLQQAEAEGLALGQEGDTYVLYNPVKAKKIIDVWKRKQSGEPIDALPSIVGMFRLSSNAKAPDVVQMGQSAAKGGYGPLLYDIAMSEVTPRWLTADRGGSTPAAISVWQYYLLNRQDDVESVSLDSLANNKLNRHPNLKTNSIAGIQKTGALGKAFRIKQPLNLNVLKGRHQEMVEYASGTDFFKDWGMTAHAFFSGKYRM